MTSPRRTRWAGAGCALVLFLLQAAATAGDAAWTAPPAEKNKKNPVPREAGAQAGKQIFEVNCQVCHGPQGKGDGPAGGALNPKPSDLTSKAVQSETDGELFWKISTGRGGMPPWQTLPEKDRWSLVDYIRTLGRK